MLLEIGVAVLELRREFYGNSKPLQRRDTSEVGLYRLQLLLFYYPVSVLVSFQVMLL